MPEEVLPFDRMRFPDGRTGVLTQPLRDAPKYYGVGPWKDIVLVERNVRDEHPL